MSGKVLELFDKFYLRLGFTRLGNFSSPILIKANTFSFPMRSFVYNFKVTDASEAIDRVGIFSRAGDIVVKTIMHYTGHTEGKFKPEFTNGNMYISNMAKNYPSIRYLRDTGQTAFTMKRDTVFVYNYGCLTNRHEYYRNEYQYYWKYNNCINTVIENINSSTHDNIFLVLELPDRLPPYNRLIDWCHNLSFQRIRKITNYRFFTLFELFKFFIPELREQSIFNKIDKDKLIKVNLLFTFNNVVTVNNLGILNDLISEFSTGKSTDVSNESLNDIFNMDVNLLGLNLGIEDAKFRGKVSLKAKIFSKLLFCYFDRIITSGTGEDDSKIKAGAIEEEDAKITSDVKKSETRTNASVGEDDVLDKELIKKIDDETKSGYKSETVDDDHLFDDEKSNNTKIEEDDEDNGTSISTIVENVPGEQKKFNSVSEVLMDKDSNSKLKLEESINNLKESGVISKNTMNSLKDKIGTDFHVQIGKHIDVTSTKELLESETKQQLEGYDIRDDKTVTDKSFNSNIVNVFDEQYITKEYAKDITKTIFSLEKANVVIEDYDVHPSENGDDTQTHILKIKPLNGQSSTIKFVIPTPNKDGTFVLSDNTYRMRKQRQQIPIYKVSATQVALNSYYGKVFINKALKKVDTFGHWLYKQLLKNPSVNNVTVGELNVPDVKLFKIYGDIARGIKFFNLELKGKDDKSLRVLKFCFEYSNRHGFLQDNDEVVTEIEKNGNIIVGQSLTFLPNKEEPIKEIISMDNRGYLFLHDYKGPGRELESFFTLLNLDPSDGPIEFCSIKIMKENVPIALVLGYYMGLENLMNSLQCKFLLLDSKSKKKLEETFGNNKYYVIRFSNTYLAIERDYGLGDLIMGSLLSISKDLTDISYDSLQDKTGFMSALSILDYPSLHLKEIKIMEDMFIDPMTKNVLNELGLPETFKGLLIKACEMLVDDTHSRFNNIEGQMIKGYERISGMLYKVIVNAVREHENRAVFARSRITVDPFIVTSMVKEDNGTIQVDDINPISLIKTAGEVTYLGIGGRSIETMTKETRIRDSSEIDLFSESVKDNGSVAVLSNMSPTPKLTSVRGLVSKEPPVKGWANKLSAPALLAPFSKNDDGKRINFISIMAGHIVPINKMEVPRLRTGYESIIPITSSDKYAITAKRDGVVLESTSKEVTVKYDNDEKVTYKCIKWTTKEESGACYTHELIPNLKKGEKFSKDDTIIYDPIFFEPDVFNRKRVLYKQGCYINVAILENAEELEDSGTLSSRIARDLGTTVTKVHSIVINATDEVFNMVKIGDEVEHTTPLFSFISGEAASIPGMDAKALEILKELRTSTPKAKVKGVIDNIVVKYNCEIKEASKSVQEIIKDSDKRSEFNRDKTGRITNNYSVRGKALLPGEIEIKIYIKVNEKMGIGDKGVFGNQIKFTVCDVFDEERVTEESNDPIDATFGFISLQARIVNSPMLIGTTAMLIDKVQEKMVEMYFGKK